MMEFIISIICIFLTLVLILFYDRRKITTIQVIIIAWCLQAYSIFGPTLTPLFFVSIYISLKEFFWLINNKAKINTSIFLFFLLPTLSGIIFMISYIFLDYIFEVPNSYLTVTNFVYFYLKFYIPFFLVGSRVFRESETSSDIVNFISKIALFSACVGIVQLFVVLFINNQELHKIIGLKEYYYSLKGIRLIRINAFLAEPKEFAGLLGISLPIFLSKRNWKKLIICIITGFLSLSNTFLACLIIYFLFLIFNRIFKKIWQKTAITIFMLILFFNIISMAKKWIIDEYSNVKEIYIVNLVFDRAINRYRDHQFAGKEFIGIPFQADLEAPFISYFKEYPWLFFVGHGPGNSNLVPNEYFWGTWAYGSRKNGKRRWHINMGWFYLIFQTGLLTTIIYFILLSNIKSKNNFINNYYSFLLSVFFVCRVDYFIMIFFSKMKSEKINKSSN